MTILKKILMSAATGAFFSYSVAALADDTSADLVANALIHGDRPAADAEDDARRMPLEVLAFAGLEEGMTILEMEAGGGWYTEILSRAVGKSGTIIMQNPPAFDGFSADAVRERLADDRMPNVRFSRVNFDELDAADNSVDMVTWILGPHELWFEPGGQNLGDPQGTFNEIARVLKPGGVFLAIDHDAEASAGPEVGGTLHRIGEGIVRELAAGAGLELIRSSRMHRNENDPRTAGVFDPSIAGRTDKFVLLYRK